MSNNYKNKKVAVLGWGINGKDACDYLIESGSKITVYDFKSEKELDIPKEYKKKAKFLLGKDYLDKGLKDYDYIFRSPVVYPHNPKLLEAKNAGVVVTSPCEEFFRKCPGKIIAVTGTKGKGTTSTLINEILKKANIDTYLAGNIGLPILSLLPRLNKSSWVVLELSSFMLMDLKLSPHIAVVLNITEDHLDWHKNRDEYIEAKKAIVKYQHKEDFAVLNFDYQTSKYFENYTEASVYWFSTKTKVEGSFIDSNAKIQLKIGENEIDIGYTNKLLLKGKHNWENICASVIASYLAGASVQSIKQTVFKFKGLEHRLEFVKKVDGISFYDDSFSTNAQTTIAAVNSFTKNITLILGGFDKGLNYDDMGRVITQSTVLNIILIGDVRNKIKNSLEKAGFKGNIIDMGYKNMKEIVNKCFEITKVDGVVILSPAAASFDMFKDYKDRGNQFKKFINHEME